MINMIYSLPNSYVLKKDRMTYQSSVGIYGAWETEEVFCWSKK